MLGYYRGVDHTDRRPATMIARFFMAGLTVFMTACQSPAASLAIIDPVFAYISPDAVQAFSSAARELTLLPDADASATLYATLDEQDPGTVFLSPLLASAIEPILARNAETRVVYFGPLQQTPHPRLHAAVFSSADAASRGGALAAAETSRLLAGLPAGTPPPVVAAIFAGTADAETVSEAFTEAYFASGGTGEPMVEISGQGFAQAVAERLRTLDIRVGYIAAAPRDAERWVRQAFDQNAYVVMEYALPSPRATSRADVFIVWDIEETLSALVQKLPAEATGTEKGRWKTVPNDQTGINRR